ncbi:MAG: flagellar basal-body MS-ring/collar protein FliF [Blastomonas sp.]
MSEITLASQDTGGAMPDGNPASTTLRPIAMPGVNFSGGNFGAQMRGFMAQPAVARALPMIGFIAVVAMAVLAWAALREPPQRDLFRGLPDNDKAAVATALDSAGIDFDFADNSGAITVSENDYHNAKMMLAAQGLPRSAPSGDDLVSSMPMGASRAVEGEKLRTAREMDLARSIEAIDSVVSARVHLAIDPPSIFIRDRNEPAASVILQLAQAGRLGDSQVQAIVHLVASSVPGLSADNVSVVDQNGRLLSGDSNGPGNDESERQLRLKEQVEERYRRSLTTLLTPVLGEGNFVAEVSADIDFTERQATSETFPADEARVRSEQRSFSTEEQDNLGGGVPGALGNAPPADTELATNGPGDANSEVPELAATPAGRRNEQITRSFELGRQVAVTREPSGNVTRISAAVAVRNLPGGKERSKAELAAIEALVKGAIGFRDDRGDQVAISSRNFQTVTEEELPWYEASWVGMLVRNISALLVALAIVFGIGRPLLKRRAKAQEADPDAVAAAASPLLAQAMGRSPAGAAAPPPPAESPPVTLDMISAAQSYQERALLIQNFVRQNPDHATLVVRDLLRAGNGELKEPANA